MMKKCLWIIYFMVLTIMASQSQSIFIVTDDPYLEQPGMGNLGDFLRNLGYSVTVDPGIEASADPGGDDSAFHGALSAEKVAMLESHDLMIFHRATNSGDFTAGADQWNGLKVPLLNGSSYTARASRWMWMPNSDAPVDNVELLLVFDETHPILNGVTIEDGYARLFDVPQDVNGLQVNGDVGNGHVVAETEFIFHTAIAVWDNPGAFYEGGASHSNRVVFFALSRYFEDDGSGTIAFEYYSEDGRKMLANAVEYAIYGEVTGQTPNTAIPLWELH